MLDEYCKPYVLEVNHTPSFVTDTPLDYHIKYKKNHNKENFKMA